MATEYAPGIIEFDFEKARDRAAMMRERGLDIDMASLIYPGPRSHNHGIPARQGLAGDRGARDELLTRNGLQPPDRSDFSPLGDIVYVSAVLG